ncbi:hypothetical protein [Rhodococcus koreensis]|uniref:ankyrin repeat domain-containing protein n=1 Tax=Rhodococcus koreensis TaxID=99653 RepID=UPI0036719A9C
MTLQRGAALRRVNRYGGAALIPAREHGHVATVRRLTGVGVDVNHINKPRRTALHEAIVYGDGSERYQQIVTALLDAGAGPSIRDGAGRSALDNAERLGQDAIVSILRAHAWEGNVVKGEENSSAAGGFARRVHRSRWRSPLRAVIVEAVAQYTGGSQRGHQYVRRPLPTPSPASVTAAIDARLNSATIYASGEPCPICSAAIAWAGVTRRRRRLRAGSTAIIGGHPRFALRCAEAIRSGDTSVTVSSVSLDDEALVPFRRAISAIGLWPGRRQAGAHRRFGTLRRSS